MIAPEKTVARPGPQEKSLDQGAAEAGKPASVQVDGPQGDVTASVRQIEARKAEKTEAHSREVANRVKWE